ncbi:MAG: hypothetical protein QOJ98_1006, partial [Acidobacteriota bacterium]|nr:hypothetical protein [Acidobacteriota bacterium]
MHLRPLTAKLVLLVSAILVAG